ncbi:hypothetical protein BDZ89DRAFT_273388 [Hymenopellis radicata]|nr:hypothetical protein BDZ89DRAFT_273388 [Hymenopellis radicata]
MSARPITESDIRNLSRGDLLAIAQAQRPQWQKTDTYNFNLDRRLGVVNLRRLLLDPNESFTITPSIGSTTNAVHDDSRLAGGTVEPTVHSTIQDALPSATKKTLIVKIIDARFTQERHRAYTITVPADPTREGCQPGEWKVQSRVLIETLNVEAGAQRLLDGPYRISTPVIRDEPQFFEDFLVERVYRHELLRVAHTNSILIKVEEALTVDDVRRLNTHLTGLKRKILSASGSKQDDQAADIIEVSDNEETADATDSTAPLIRAQNMQLPPERKRRKKSRQSGKANDYDPNDLALVQLLRDLISTTKAADYATFCEHRGRSKLSNAQFIADWRFGVDFCRAYHKQTITGSQRRIDYKHIYGALECSETWLREARSIIQLVDKYGPGGDSANEGVIAYITDTEPSLAGRKGVIQCLEAASL